MNKLFLMQAVCIDTVDPDRKCRVKLRFQSLPLPRGGDPVLWARSCIPPNATGAAVTTPMVGDKVWVMFENGDAERPVWLGIDPWR